MAVITPFAGILPSKGQSVTEFNSNVASFLAYILTLGPEINTAIAEILVGASVSVYNAGTTYNAPTIVAGSDGNRYACVGTSVTGDNPVTSDTGNWVQLTLDSADLFPTITTAVPIEGDIRGGNITVSGNVLTITPCSCKDSAGQVALYTGVNKTVTIPSAYNTTYHIYAVKLVADGSCEFRAYVSEVAATADSQVSARRRIDFCLTDGGGVVVPFYSVRGLHVNTDPSKSVSSTASASRAVYSISAQVPENIVAAVIPAIYTTDTTTNTGWATTFYLGAQTTILARYSFNPAYGTASWGSLPNDQMIPLPWITGGIEIVSTNTSFSLCVRAVYLKR